MIIRIRQDLETQAADHMVDARIVIRQRLGIEDVISVQSICEVVLREVCTEPVISSNPLQAYFRRHLPRDDDLIVNAVQFHMLQAPALIDTLRDPFLPQTGQVGSMEHPNLYPLRSVG